MPARPNLVLMHSHDTGRHLGVYGAGVPTPNLMRIAREGVVFRQAFCASPGCSSSRASLMTGQWPHTHGLIGLVHRGWRMSDPKNSHLSHLLSNAGYNTQLIGFQHEVPDAAQELGYKNVIHSDKLNFHSRARGEAAVKWIENAPAEPFFLNVGFVETHREFLPVEPPDDERFTAPVSWLPDTAEVRRDVAELNTAVRHVDDAVGAIVAALEKRKLLDNTLIIYTTDHGVPFPRAKATLYDAGIGVALIMRGPGGISGGQALDAIVSQIDILPTFFNLAELPLPAGVQGTSLLPLVQKKVGAAHDEVFAEITYHAAYDPARCIRTRFFKYIRHFGDLPKMPMSNIDNGSAKTFVSDHGYPRLERPREMLFDLVADPQEFENLAAVPEYAKEKADLAARLQKWMERTNDPILATGNVAMPPGAEVTPFHWYGPRTEKKPS
jgi:arylsulfatase A-like enzyme